MSVNYMWQEPHKEDKPSNDNSFLDIVMPRFFAFEDYCRRTYEASINGRFFKNGYEIDYGEGITKEQAYEEFEKHNEA